MKKSRFSEEQKIGILHQAAAGAQIRELCRKHGITETTFFRWRGKYGGLQVSEAKRLRALEDENRRLKKLVADLSLDNAMLKKKWWDESGDHQAAAAGRHPSPGRLPHGRAACLPALAPEPLALAVPLAPRG